MNKRLFILVLALLLLHPVLIPVSAVSVDSIDSYNISLPYLYTVLPGSSEWYSLSMHERIACSHVDEQLLKNMTTEAVLLTTLNYPFIINIFAYDTTCNGIEIVSEYCSPLAELLTREDALHVINSYLNVTTDNESLEYYVAEQLWEYVNASTLIIPRYVIDPITGWRVFYVETPNGSDVPVYKNLTWDDHNTTYDEVSIANTTVLDVYGVVSVGSIDPSYNCHSYAWHSASVSNDYWMENPAKYIIDGSYILGTGSVGNRITYNADDGTYIHSGIVTSSNTITSKWGILGVYEHSVNACPYYVQSTAICFWQRA